MRRKTRLLDWWKKTNKMKSENAELRRAIEKMSSENEQVRLENEQMRREMENLRTGHSFL